MQIGEKTHTLGPGNFGLIPTGVRARVAQRRQRAGALARDASAAAAADRNTAAIRFLPANAPRARTPARPDRPFRRIATAPPRRRRRKWKASIQPPASPSRCSSTARSAPSHQSLFLIQYSPGAKIDPHDHTFEESYFIVGGRVHAVADGKSYDLGPGDVIWTGVGCIHSFANDGAEPVRWIETQAPLPPAKEVFRFERDWAKFAYP